MASISSLSGSSSTSSIYGNRNIISGLASGLDTETLIENAVSAYQTKIQSLQQKQTQVQWKQEAYRSILDKMITMNRKYTSYTSNTNLFSQSFFNKAVKNSVMGTNASAVSATGRTNSDVQINSISQLATSAKYTADVSASDLLSGITGVLNADGTTMTTKGIESFDLTQPMQVGSLSGGMAITYGGNSVYLSFSEKDVYNNAEEMAEGIREKLGEAMVRTGSGEYVKASDRIDVKVDSSGNISFADKTSAGNSVYISSADTALQKTLGIDPGKDAKGFRAVSGLISHKEDAATYLSKKTMNVTLNGKSQTISFDGMKDDIDKAYDAWANEAEKPGGELNPNEGPLSDEEKARVMTTNRNRIVREEFQKRLQSELDDAFGKDRIKASLVNDGNGKSQLSFETKKGDTLAITSDASKALGLGEDGLTSYVNTGMKLKDIFTGDNAFRNMEKDDVEAKLIASSKEALENDSSKKYYLDTDGKTLLDKDGNTITKKKELTVNGTKFEFDDTTTLESMINRINGSKEAGVTISYSKLSNQFSIAAKDTGVNSDIEISGELAKIFGQVDSTDDMKMVLNADNYVQGQDAVFNVTVNGETMDMTRATNEIDFDGMTVTLKSTFGGTRTEPVMVQEVDATTNKPLYNQDGTPKLTELKDADGNVVMQEVKGSNDPITFKSEADADKIVEAIQSFVDDYNAMVTEIREQYATQPAEKSSTNHTRYMPLTDEDKEGMSESAIAAYEEKAKQGILFGETELSSLHNALRNAITGVSSDVNVSYTDSAEFNRMMQEIGLTTSYSGGLTTLSLDTDKLREAIASDPDKVRDTFTQTVENGASTDGLMQRFQKVMNQYANTSSGSPGILVSRAGSQYAPNSINNNSLQDLYDSYTEQIEKIQDKMSDRIDYYTRQFTALEQLIAQMNSQSSALSGLMGGSSGY